MKQDITIEDVIARQCIKKAEEEIKRIRKQKSISENKQSNAVSNVAKKGGG